jgi:hypothetical protein
MKHTRVLFVAFFVTFAITFCSNRPSEAQTAIYAGFSGASVNGGPSGSTFGALVGLYAQSGHYAYFGGDFRGSLLSHNGFGYYTGALGPRLALKPPLLPIRPYIEGLVGVASYNSGTHLNYHGVVGVDWTLLPHIDWRVIDYDYSGTSGPVSANIFSTGLAIRLW